MSDLALQYAEVGQVARGWDEQHHRLAAAAGQVGDAPLAGLTATVRPAAMVFCVRWAEHVGDLAARAEVRADGLRDALREFVASDASSVFEAARLHHLLTEVR